MAAARAAKHAYLHAIMFAPMPSFPGAEFGLAAPVIVPPSLPASNFPTNTFELAAAFGGPAPVPAPFQRRDDVPPGLASLLQAAERASHEPPSGVSHKAYDPYLAQSSPWQLGFAPSLTPERSYAAPVGATAATADFLAFLQESYSVLMHNGALAFGHLQSPLQQLVLLQHWLPILDRMAPVHKNLLWETCNMFPGFRVTNPKLTSYRKMVSAWGANIAMYVTNITALFAAVGYLKHHDILKNDFCFPNTEQPVFRAFISSSKVAAPVRNKRLK